MGGGVVGGRRGVGERRGVGGERGGGRKVRNSKVKLMWVVGGMRGLPEQSDCYQVIIFLGIV